MKKLTLPLLGIILSMSLSGCGLMEDAFKAGIIFALVIIAIIGLLVWILRTGVSRLNQKYVFLPVEHKDKLPGK